MAGAKKVGVGHIFLPNDLQIKIDNIITKLNISAAELSSKTSESFKNIDEVLNTVLVILGWILVTCTFITSGVFLLVHNVVGDTCVAMDEWVARQHTHTALGDLIPCVNAATANESLSRSKEVTFELIQVVNEVILNVSNANFPSRIFNPPLSYNQSGPPMPILCNPYKPDLTDRKCRPGEVNFDDASTVWKRFVCNTKVVAGNEICSSVGRITPSMFNEMTGATNMSQGLYLYVPFLFKIADCTVARETLGSISSDYCPGVELHSKTIVLGLVVVSTTMMLSIIFWMILAKQRKHRRYSKKYTNQEGPLMAGYKL
ncbi:hypothetical protein HPP92_010340 [Vanilla planifolia]|uniref:Uncharacterized protein n=1 Tax=Vanilla planifolia TaxID=51239 RepID=A0A835QYQ2_VANPL|nr:hypothetical protein HPP92_010340 [Vanilla planifolia]